MELESLHTLARTEEGEPLWITYKLLEEGGRYGVLCYLEGMEQNHPCARSRLADLCPTEEAAETLLFRLAGEKVLPAHLPDLVWELAPST